MVGMNSASKSPTPQGISALLKRAGFDKAVVTNNSRYVKENTAGFHVGKYVGGEVIVNYWPASVLPTARTTAYVEQARRHERVMLEQYAHAIDEAGWRVELTTLRNLRVFAAKEADL